MIVARAIAAVALLSAPGVVTAHCTDAPAETYLEELNRINDCLKAVARRPHTLHDTAGVGYDETRLYTWARREKFNRMQNDRYFCDYEYARQREFEAIKYYNLPQTTVRRWYGWQPPGAEAPVRTLSGLAALGLGSAEQRRLSLQFLFPGWYGRAASLDARKAQVAEQAGQSADEPLSPSRSAAEGRLAAYAMDIDGRPSSIKGGLGVYFAADPFRYYVAGENDHGLVCTVPNQAVIVDASNEDTRTTLIGQQIFYEVAPELPAAGIVNQIENPLAFDEAALGDTILRVDFGEDPIRPRDRAYVDKCAIQYTECDPIDASARSLSCEDFRRLAGMTRNAAGELKPLPPSSFPVSPGVFGWIARQPGFVADFRAQLSKCLGLDDDADTREILTLLGRQPFADALAIAARSP